MKRFFCGLFGAVIVALVFASCSGTAGGENVNSVDQPYQPQSGDKYFTEVHGKIVSAVATEIGILFTVKTDDFTNGVSHIDFWESRGTGMELGASDKTQIVGLYPLVQAGKSYEFYVFVYEEQTGNCLHEVLQVDAIGGLGEPTYDLSSVPVVKLSCVNKVPAVEVSGIYTPELTNGTITKSWLWYGFEATDAESGNSYENERWMCYDAPDIEGFDMNQNVDLREWFKTSFEATGKKNFYVRTEVRYYLEDKNTTHTTSYCLFKKELICSNVVEYK